MVYRMLEKNPSGEKLDVEEKKKYYKKSIELATKAISHDMADAQSWYILGNAHLTNFFVNNESTTELEKSLKAYSLTERYMKEPNPDLFFNRGTVLEYLERYNEAVQNFSMAHTIDPNLGGESKANAIIGFVSRAYNAINSKGKIKTNKLTAMVKSIPQSFSAPEADSTASDQFKVVDIS